MWVLKTFATLYNTDFDQTWSDLVIGVVTLGAVLMNGTIRQLALCISGHMKD